MALKKYAVFAGRSQRSEYWSFVLLNLVFTVILYSIDNIVSWNYLMYAGVLSSIYSLAIVIPGIAVAIRRLHDTDRTGWWLLIALVPLIGAIILIVFFAQDSQSGDNRYGPNPKTV